MNHTWVEIVFVLTTLAFNLLIAGVYIATRHDSGLWVRWLGKGFLLLAVPYTIVLIDGLVNSLETWMIVILGLTLGYILVELLFDFLLKIGFRQKPILHVPYLIHFYIVLFGLIGIAFSIERTWGWVVSVSFWLLLASLIYMIVGRRRDAANSAGRFRQPTDGFM